VRCGFYQLARGYSSSLLEGRCKKAPLSAIPIPAVLPSHKVHFCYERALKVKGYASDGVWYATSARAILQEVLGAEPKFYRDGVRVYAVFCIVERGY